MRQALVTLLGAALLVSGCDSGKSETSAASSAKPAGSTQPAAATATAADSADAKPAKLDSEGLEALADAVKFELKAGEDKGFEGKVTNTGGHKISRLEFWAYAYAADGTLIERVKGKYPKALEPGKSGEVKVGPFEKAGGKDGVEIEGVVSWLNAGGPMYQRPVPKDRAKGGPNNAIKKK